MSKFFSQGEVIKRSTERKASVGMEDLKMEGSDGKKNAKKFVGRWPGTQKKEPRDFFRYNKERRESS